jgi:hypothetical protein
MREGRKRAREMSARRRRIERGNGGTERMRKLAAAAQGIRAL